MDIINFIVILVMISAIVSNVRTKSQITRMIEGKPVQLDKMLEAPKEKEHRLVRTWIVSTQDGRISAGWRWRCSCSVWGVTEDANHFFNRRDNTTSYELGTEAKAIEGFKKHADMYREVNTDHYKVLYERLDAEFADYRSKCYCKDANHELLPWKDK